ncbi:8-oxo-dGTP diphosphatase [Mariniphaga anaerophila]|uniref:8-oxo-dGTP diphosphatase n=1 Tax=Mariniphaga anaerophila TaxID=1484053 RepID=A0A1M4XMF5_9BACT|nr:NUDIX hydrolase [Mariniphaga anaerophila]SHE94600.1 8-oxo-dGTP diphosphatase [Mariniphaga anaerophila]
MYSYKYPRPALTVDALVYVKEESDIFVLLIQRGIEPFKGMWALPGGFVNMDELLETACKRELEEETGLQVKKMDQFKAFDAINRDPRHRTISVVFSVQLPEKTDVKGGDDAASAKWFSVNNLPEMAFDHRKILEEYF